MPPEPSSAGRHTPRNFDLVTVSRMTAATPNRATVSQPGGSHSRATLDSGTVVPHNRPAAVSAPIARRRSVYMDPSSVRRAQSFPPQTVDDIKFRNMAVELDDVDVKLLTAL